MNLADPSCVLPLPLEGMKPDDRFCYILMVGLPQQKETAEYAEYAEKCSFASDKRFAQGYRNRDNQPHPELCAPQSQWAVQN